MKRFIEWIKVKLNFSDNSISERFEITEHISSNWVYHISHKETPNISLCGKRVMNSRKSFSQWGIVPEHIPEKYCKECSEKFIRLVGNYYI